MVALDSQEREDAGGPLTLAIPSTRLDFTADWILPRVALRFGAVFGP